MAANRQITSYEVNHLISQLREVGETLQRIANRKCALCDGSGMGAGNPCTACRGRGY